MQRCSYVLLGLIVVAFVARDIHAWVDFAPGDKLGLWSTFWNFQDDEKMAKKLTLLRSVSAGFPKGEKQRDVLVRLAVAPWRPYQVIDLKRKRPQPEGDAKKKPEDGTVQLRRVHERTDGTTQVDLAFPAKFDLRAHHEVVGEDLDGKKVKLYAFTVADAGTRGLIFVCPLDRLAKVRVRFRWYTHEVTFRDVSLHLEHVTQVKAKVTKLEPPPEPHAATLPNGVTVKLVGVGLHPSDQCAWWQADGKPLDERPYEKFQGSVMKGDPKRVDCREFALQVQDLPKDHAVTTHFSRPVGSSVLGQSQDGVYSLAVAAGPFPGDKTTSVRIGLSFEPLGPRQGIGADGRKLATVDVPPDVRMLYDLIQPMRVESRNAEIELVLKPFEELPKQADWRLVAIDKDGQETRSTSQSNDGREATIGFKLPLERLARFEYHLRRYRHWVTFENVSLDPGKKTDVNVKVAFEPIALQATIFLRFAEAKSAVAALKDEAARRKLRGFEATIDPRLNAVTITADADTLKTLQEVLGRLDSK